MIGLHTRRSGFDDSKCPPAPPCAGHGGAAGGQRPDRRVLRLRRRRLRLLAPPAVLRPGSAPPTGHCAALFFPGRVHRDVSHPPPSRHPPRPHGAHRPPGPPGAVLQEQAERSGPKRPGLGRAASRPDRRDHVPHGRRPGGGGPAGRAGGPGQWRVAVGDGHGHAGGRHPGGFDPAA